MDEITLPTFLICGAKKSGTTSLYRYLDEHPEICMSDPKETNFFYAHYDKGWEWLASHFPDCSDAVAIGEASTMTMASEQAPARIAEHLSDVKLLFVLRNPITRAYSQYYFYLYTGNAATPASFHEIIRDEQSAFRNEIIQLGKYDEQLARFDECFSPDQMKVILSSDLRRETLRVVQDVYAFLGVNPDYVPSASDRYNETRYPTSPASYYWIRKLWQPVRLVADRLVPQTADRLRARARSVLFDEAKPEMRDEDRAYLRAIYAETIARLEQRLDRDLSHWK